jgi:methanogenic corrinoid protein MtbC1
MTSDRTPTGLDAALNAGPSGEFGQKSKQSLEQTLARLVASHVVPRLAVVTKSKVANPGRQSTWTQGHDAGTPFDEAALDAFGTQLTSAPDLELVDTIDQLLSQGHTVATLLLDLFGPTAIRLGDLWNEDKISFVDVTVGVGRLQQLIKALPAGLPVAAQGGRHILLLPTPGEDHSLGVVALADVLQRAGWSVTLGHQMTQAELRSTLRRQQFLAVGFSLSTDVLLDRLTMAIREVRTVLDGAPMPILVGGNAFDRNPLLVSRVGADAAPGGARQTLEYLARFAALEEAASAKAHDPVRAAR